jgi:hypothetical protein
MNKQYDVRINPCQEQGSERILKGNESWSRVEQSSSVQFLALFSNQQAQLHSLPLSRSPGRRLPELEQQIAQVSERNAEGNRCYASITQIRNMAKSRVAMQKHM